ncbi:MFS transporter-like protein [Lindgomyces ingoldianus]|uniref:MFS transporter-like protein n=1 Tax=Lindgomyces ingoldianus TaxID=673940 RepID=A0ACB6QZK3_9PLEO|nr:MFS transporter-like protein [Lindgomyces ingoldianus]KAF2472331.1 MFS transporter-like protein [Lindgomyces ingoldianus]
MDCDIELAGPTTLGWGIVGAHLTARGTTNVEIEDEGEPSINASGVRRRGKWRLSAIVLALFVSEFVAALDATIVATAAPTISRDLSSAAGYTWISGAYLLANAASSPIWAKLSDIWGRKLIVLLALTCFFASSAICATSKTMYALIVGRAFQGAAGGGLILLVHVCISDLFSLRQRSLLMGLTEGIWALAGGVGPVLGGVFASLVSWRWCFYINLPIIGLTFALILLFLDIKHEHTSFIDGIKAIDWIGIFTFLGFTLMVLLALDFGGAIFPWDSVKVIALLVVALVIMIFVFIYSEARVARYPLIPMEIFKKRTNVASFMVVAFHGFAFISAEYYMPLFLQSVLEATPLISGLLLLPLVVTTAITGLTSGVIIHRTGRFRELIWTGTVLLCIGFGLFISFTAHTTKAQVIGFQILAGGGSGLLFETPLIAVQSQVAQDDVATATSTLNFIRNMALAISVVIGGTIFQNSMDDRASSLRAAGLPLPLLNNFSGKSAAANVMLGSTLENPAWELAIKESFAWAIRNMWICFTGIAFLGVVAGVFIEDAHLGTEHTETVTGIKKEKRNRGSER